MENWKVSSGLSNRQSSDRSRWECSQKHKQRKRYLFIFKRIDTSSYFCEFSEDD